MKIIITEEQYNSLNEMIKLDIKVGDTLMGGKFKNKKIVVKTIGKNDKGDITINGKPLLRFRLLKEDISTEKSINLFKKWLYNNFDEISFLETSTYDGHPLIKIYYTTDSDAVNHDVWLAGEISDEWNKITGGQIPVIPRWKFSGYNAKIVIDTEEYVDDEEVINEGISIPIDKRVELFKKWLYKEYPNISHLEVTRKKDPYLHPSRFKDIPLVIVHYTESDAGGYATWQPNYRSHLTMDIVEKWNKITNNTIPITGSFFDRINHNKIQILVDVEEFSEDEGESINENDSSKLTNTIDKYIKHLAPQLSPENVKFVMSPSEDGVNIYVIDKDRFNLNSKLIGFFDNDYGSDDRRLYLEPRYSKLFEVFGNNPDLIVDWFNRTYESKLKRMFNEIDWEINSVDTVK